MTEHRNTLLPLFRDVPTPVLVVLQALSLPFYVVAGVGTAFRSYRKDLCFAASLESVAEFRRLHPKKQN